jgi:N-acetylglucosaminyldiphosphoundecaprenol N-acetyl-beta-D-mannosaminyltransferase
MKILKLKSQYQDELLDARGIYSFLNLASLTAFFKSIKETGNVEYFCDGFLMCLLVYIATGKRISRVSFDFTSIADNVFNYANKNERKIAIVGATNQELEKFVFKIKKRYEGIKIDYYRDGFFGNDESRRVAEDVISSEALILIVGLGAGKQEEFLNKCYDLGFSGAGFSCGGFIRQESYNNEDYYPRWVNKIKFRAFYRMYKEPHTIKRYFFSYPKNFFIFLYSYLSKDLSIELVPNDK